MKQILKKSNKIKQIEQREDECIEELLRKKYVDENKSMSIIAKELQISYTCVYRWLLWSGVHSRKLTL